jgi:hypothetical protein
MEKPMSDYRLDKEDVPGLNFNIAEIEAKRCYNCGCDGVNPSDIAPALIALDATIVTSKRNVQADEFWVADKGLKPTLLDEDEIITEIRIPRPAANIKSSFLKFAMRKSIDFAIVNCAAAVESKGGVVKSARICLNAVYSNPYRVTQAEEAIKGKPINEANADAAGDAAVTNAVALPYNRFKIQIAKHWSRELPGLRCVRIRHKRKNEVQMPKLLIKVFGDPGEDMCELEEAKYLIDFSSQMIVIDGQQIRSYDELAKIASQEKYRNQEFIEVVQVPAIAGG